MSKNKPEQMDMGFVMPSSGEVPAYSPKTDSLFDSPEREEPVALLVMATNNFLSLQKHQTEMPDYVSPDGKFTLKAEVIDKEAGMPLVSDLGFILYLGSLKRDRRLADQNGESKSPSNTFEIRCSDYFDFIGLERPGGKDYENFDKMLRRLEGTKYYFAQNGIQKDVDTSKIPEYEEGDEINHIKGERFVERSERIEVKKKDGRTVTSAVRVQISDYLAREYIDKAATLIFGRNYFSISQSVLRVVYLIAISMMYRKDSFTISYENLYQRSNSQNNFRQWKYKLRKMLEKSGLPDMLVDMGDSRAKNITFYKTEELKRILSYSERTSGDN